MNRAPLFVIPTLILALELHSIKPKFAPAVRLVSETICLITFLALDNFVPDFPPNVAV